MSHEVFKRLRRVAVIAAAFEAQVQAVREFHRRAAVVLAGSCRLRPTDAIAPAFEDHLFSCLFLAGAGAAGLPPNRRPWYGLLIQCLRAWVTACDNLLDDEYKETIPFDLPTGGSRFRSVLTIMAADRILADALAEEVAAGRLAAPAASALSHTTLRVLMPSGVQEHEEERGADGILAPEALLERIHTPKTGLLFESPLLLAEQMGEVGPARGAPIRAGLRAFGLACQILDDMNDLGGDVAANRHNYLRSLKHVERLSDPDAVLRAGERSGAFFAASRLHLAEGGLRFSDADWTALLQAVALRLRVPCGVASSFAWPAICSESACAS